MAYNLRMRALRIGELSSRFGLNPRTIRYYGTLGLLPPEARSESGYRLYGGQSIKRLEFILKAKGLGLSLAEIGRILDLHSSGQSPCNCTRRFLSQKVSECDEKIKSLEDLREKLNAILINKTPRARKGADICPIIISN